MENSHEKLNLTHEDYLEFSKTFCTVNEVGFVYADLEKAAPERRLSKAMFKRRNEQDSIQKKTFTKWINKYLKKHDSNMIVKDLFVDIRDGLMLIYLLEALSGSTMKKERGSNMKKLHYLSNVKIALNYLSEKKIKLVNINPSDIVEGKPVIVLGLIWLIILYFQIQENELDKKSQESGDVRQLRDNSSSDKGVKLKLLTWIQNIIPREYNITITDFGKCWRSGIAFHALIEVFNPNLVDMRIVLRSDPQENLDRAFDIAEKHLGIAKLLDSEDVIAEKPDEKSIMTYVSQFLELKITRPESPKKKLKLSILESAKPIEREINDKIKRFIINVKEARIEKLKHIENFNEIFKLISNLKNELELIPDWDEMSLTGDSTLDKDFKAAKRLVMSCQWLLDESVNNEWKNLCKWLVTSEKLLEIHRNNQIDILKEAPTELFNEINVQLKEYETHFKNSPFHSPTLAELKRCMINTDKSNKVFVSYTISVEKRIQKVVKEEFSIRQKLLLLHKISSLKIKEREINYKLQYWKRELDSLTNAKDRLLDFEKTMSNESFFTTVPEMISDIEKLISVDSKFKEWIEEYKIHWLDNEREIKYIQTSLRTYIEEWHKMEVSYKEIVDWLDSTNDFSISPNEFISRKHKIGELEKNIAFLSEQSSDSGKETLSQKLQYINSNFSKFHENKSLDVDNLRREYKIKVDNIKKWLEKSEALESFDIKFSKASINEYVKILEESNNSSENVKEDFKVVSKIGQRISRTCSKEETERMLGELKIQKIRLMTLIDDRPKLIKKLTVLCDIQDKCDSLFSDVDQYIEHVERELAEMLTSFQSKGNQQQEMLLGEINVALESIKSKELLLTNVKLYIAEIESLKVSNFPLKPIYSRENEAIEKLNNLKSFALLVSKKIQESSWLTPFKIQLETWIEESKTNLDVSENLDPDSIKPLLENSLAKKDLISIALDDILLKIQSSDDEDLKDEADILQSEFNKISSQLSEAINYQKYRMLENKCIELIKSVEKQLNDEETLVKHANFDKIQEIIYKHNVYFEANNFQITSQSYLSEMKTLLGNLPKNQTIISKQEMLERQCLDLSKRIDTVANDLSNLESSWIKKKEKILKLNELVINLTNMSSIIDLTDLNVTSDQYDMVLNKFCNLIPDVDNMREVALELRNDNILSQEEIVEETISNFESIAPSIESLKRRGSNISDAIKLKEEVEKETIKLQDLQAQLRPFSAITIGEELILLGELRQQERVVEQIQELHREIIENTKTKFIELELRDPTVAHMVLPTIENLQLLCELAESKSIEVLSHNSHIIDNKLSIKEERETLEAKILNSQEAIVPNIIENEEIRSTILEGQMSSNFINKSQSQVEHQLSEDNTDSRSNFYIAKSEKLEQIPIDVFRESNIKIVEKILTNCISHIELDLINFHNSNYRIPLDKAKTILKEEIEICENAIKNNVDNFDHNLRKIIISHGDLKDIKCVDLNEDANEILRKVEIFSEQMNSLQERLLDIQSIEDVFEWKSSCCDLGNDILSLCQSLDNIQRLLNQSSLPSKIDLSVEKIDKIFSKIELLESNSAKQAIKIQSELSLIVELESSVEGNIGCDMNQLLEYKKALDTYSEIINEIKQEEIIPFELKNFLSNLHENSEIDIAVNKINKIRHSLELKVSMLLEQENEKSNQIVNEISLQLFDEFTETDNQLDAMETVLVLQTSRMRLETIKTNTENLKILSENFGNYFSYEKINRQINKTMKDCQEISDLCVAKINAMEYCRSFVDRLNELEDQADRISYRPEDNEEIIMNKNTKINALKQNIKAIGGLLENLREIFSTNQIAICPAIEDRYANLNNQSQSIEVMLNNIIELFNENKKKFDSLMNQRITIGNKVEELLESLNRIQWKNSDRKGIEHNKKIIQQIFDQFNDQIIELNYCKQNLPDENFTEIDKTIHNFQSKLTNNNKIYEEQIDLILNINDKSKSIDCFTLHIDPNCEVGIANLIKYKMEDIQNELNSIDLLKRKIDEQFETDDGELLLLLDGKQSQLNNDLETINLVSENHNTLIDLSNEVNSISNQIDQSISTIKSILNSPEKSTVDVEDMLQHINNNLEKIMNIQTRLPLSLTPVSNKILFRIQTKLSKDINESINATQLSLDPIHTLINQYQIWKTDIDKCSDEVHYLDQISSNVLNLPMIEEQLKQIDIITATLVGIHDQVDVNKDMFQMFEICEISDQCVSNEDKLKQIKHKILKQQEQIRKDQEQLGTLTNQFNDIKAVTWKRLSDFSSKFNMKESILSLESFENTLCFGKENVDILKNLAENIQKFNSEISIDCAKQMEEIEVLLVNLEQSFVEISKVVETGNGRVDEIKDNYEELLTKFKLDLEVVDPDLDELVKTIERCHSLKAELAEVENGNYYKLEEINDLLNRSVSINDNIDNFISHLKLKLIEGQENRKQFINTKTTLITKHEDIKLIINKINLFINNFSNDLQWSKLEIENVEYFLQIIQKDVERLSYIQSNELNFSSPISNNEILELQNMISIEIEECTQSTMVYLNPILDSLGKYQILKQQCDQYSDEIDFLEHEVLTEMNFEVLSKRFDEVNKLLENENHLKDEIEICKSILNVHETIGLYEECEHQIKTLKHMNKDIETQIKSINDDKQRLDELLTFFIEIKNDFEESLSDFTRKINDKKELLSIEKMNNVEMKAKEKMNILTETKEKIKEYNIQESLNREIEIKNLSEFLSKFEIDFNNIKKIVEDGNKNLQEIDDEYQKLIQSDVEQIKKPETDILMILKSKKDQIENLDKRLGFIVNKIYPNFVEINEFIDKTKLLDSNINLLSQSINSQSEIETEKQLIFNNLKNKLINISEEVKFIYEKILTTQNLIFKSPHSSMKDIEILIGNIEQDVSQLTSIQLQKLNITSPVFSDNQISQIQQTISNEITRYVGNTKASLNEIRDSISQFYIYQEDFDKYSYQFDLLSYESIPDSNMESLNNRIVEINKLLKYLDFIRSNIKNLKLTFNCYEIDNLCNKCTDLMLKLQELSRKIKDQQETNRINDEKLKDLLENFQTNEENISSKLKITLDMSIDENACLNLTDIKNFLKEFDEALGTLNDLINKIDQLNHSSAEESRLRLDDLKLLSEDLINLYNNVDNIVKEKSIELNKIDNEYNTMIEIDEFETVKNLEVKRDQLKELKDQMSMFNRIDQLNFHEIRDLESKTTNIVQKIEMSLEDLNSKIETEQSREELLCKIDSELEENLKEIHILFLSLCSTESMKTLEEVNKRLQSLSESMKCINEELKNEILNQITIPDGMSKKINDINDKLSQLNEISFEVKEDINKNLEMLNFYKPLIERNDLILTELTESSELSENSQSTLEDVNRQLIQYKNSLLLTSDTANKHICKEIADLEGSKSKEIENINNILNQVQMLNEKFQIEKSKKEFCNYLEKVKIEIDSLKEILELGNLNLSNEEIADLINGNLLAVHDLEGKYKDNPISTEYMPRVIEYKNIAEGIGNQFKEYLFVLEHQRAIITNADQILGQVNEQLNTDLHSTNDRKTKIGKLTELKSQLEYPKLTIDNKSKESQILTVKLAEINENFQKLQEKILEEIQYEKIKIKLDEIDRLLHIFIDDNNIDYSLRDIDNYFYQLNSLMESVCREINEMDSQTNQDLESLSEVNIKKSHIRQIDVQIADLKDQIKSGGIIYGKHCQIIKEFTETKPIENLNEIIELKSNFNEHLENLIQSKNDLKSEIRCQDLKELISKFEDSIDETNKILKDLKSEDDKVRIKGELLAILKTIEAGIKRVAEVISGENECLAKDEIDKQLLVIKNNLSKIQILIDENETGKMIEEKLKLRFFSTSERFVEYEKSVKEKSSALSQLEMEEEIIFKNISTYESIIDDANEIKELETFVDNVKDIISNLTDIGKRYQEEGLYCIERSVGSSKVDKELANISRIKSLLEKKIKFKLDKEAALSDIKTFLLKIEMRLENFKISLQMDSQNTVTLNTIQQVFADIETDFSRFQKSDLLDETEFEEMIKDVRLNINRNKEYLSTLLQRITVKDNGHKILQNQFNNFTNLDQQIPINFVDRYKNYRSNLNRYENCRLLNDDLLKEVKDLETEIHCREVTDLKENIERFDELIKTQMTSEESGINKMIDDLRDNLEQAKVEQEIWLKEIIKTLQNSTQNSNLVPKIIQSKKESLENLMGSLEIGHEMIDKIYELEEQMKEINSEFNDNQCTHRDRKASVIQYMELVQESQRRFADISDKYAQASEIANSLGGFLRDLQIKLMNIPKENINVEEINQFIFDLQRYRNSVESKGSMKDNLLLLEKALVSESVSTNDLNTIEIENLYVKTLEDVDDLIGMMNEIVKKYDELNVKLTDENRISEEILASVSVSLDSDYKREESSLLDNHETFKSLRQKLLDQHVAVRQLGNEIENVHKEKSLISEMIPTVQKMESNLETNLKLVTEKIDDIQLKITLINNANVQMQELTDALDGIETDIQCLKSDNDISNEFEFWERKMDKLQDISISLSEYDGKLDRLIEEVKVNAIEMSFINVKNRIIGNEELIGSHFKNWQYMKTISMEKENILNLINFLDKRIKFAEICENEIDLLDNAQRDMRKLNEDINSLDNKIHKINCIQMDNLSDNEQAYINSIVEVLETKLLNSSTKQKLICNNLDEKLNQLNLLNDIHIDVMKITDGIFMNTLNSTDDCDSLLLKLDGMILRLEDINHPDIICDKKSKIVHLTHVLCETQNIVKEVQSRIIMFECIQNDMKVSELQIQNAQRLLLDSHSIDVDQIEDDITNIENQLESIRMKIEQNSSDLDVFHNDLLYFMSNISLGNLSRQLELLDEIKSDLNEHIKSLESQQEERFEPTLIENVNQQSNFSFLVEDDETEVHSSKIEASKRSSNDLVIDEDSIKTVSNSHLTHKEELNELSGWVSNEMESLNNIERSLTFDNTSFSAIKPLIEQLEVKKNDLNLLECSIAQLRDKEAFASELLLLKSKLAAYEDYLLNTLESTTDLDNCLSNFRQLANLIFDWIRKSKEKIEEESSPLQQKAILDKLKTDSDEIQMTKIKELESIVCEIEKFDIIQDNANIQDSVKALFEQVLGKYDEFNTQIADFYKNSPIRELENLIDVCEEFVYVIFPKWYKEQFKNTIISGKECIIRITENRMKLAFIEENSEKLNKLIDECNVPWHKILLDRHVNIPPHDINATNNILQIRHAKVITKMFEIYKSLEKWMIILEDLKVKWQELNANQDQFQSWLIEIERKGDLREGKPLHLNDNSLKEKINFLKNLKLEIDNNSSELIKMMIIDDEVTTVTFSPELNNGENLRSTNTLSDKINSQYTLLTDKVLRQIEKWHNIFDKVEMFHRSADDLKEDFIHLQERVQKLEIQSPLTRDKLNSLKTTTEPSFSQHSLKYTKTCSNLRNSGSNHGISKLLWPYSRKSDHSAGDCEMNKSSQSLLCYNYEDVRSSREKRFSSSVNINCLATSINSLSECLTINDKLSTIDCPSFRSEVSQSTNLMNIPYNSHIKPTEGSNDSCILNSSRSDWSTKKMKTHSSTNHSSGYRSYISSSNCSTYRS